jgi:hypothetical protein
MKQVSLFFTRFVFVNHIHISVLKKYLFGIIVTAYVLSAVGVPVYLHYCGGELEKINYVIKSNSCCGGEEDDSQATANDCCSDENLVMQNTPDFTIKHFNNYDLVKTFCDLFYVSLPFSINIIQPDITQNLASLDFPPPKLQQGLAVSTSVLRI